MGTKVSICLLLIGALLLTSMISVMSDGSEPRMRTDLSWSNASFIGEEKGDFCGNDVACAGDVNGDGYDDILICAFGYDKGGDYAGQTYLILGKASGWTMDTDLGNADASYLGEDSYDYSGYRASGAGDVNGDGFDDFVIGAWGDEDGGSNKGQTYLIFGRSSGWTMDTSLSNADASFIGEDTDDYSGCAVAGAGDVNGDGYDDLLIGALGDEEGGNLAGQTYLILGKSSGWSMDTSLSNADASFIGEDANDESGRSVAGAGDVNGDGYDDFLIGAWLNSNGGTYAGQTYLILGKPSGWAKDTDLSSSSASFLGEKANDQSGWSIAGAGDVNGDGYDDILIGSHLNKEGGDRSGQTYLIFGKSSGWSMDYDLSNADASFIGEDTFDYSGYSIAGVGDVNRDGFDDIAIGAYGDEHGGSYAGQTYLIYGRSSGWSMDTALSNADASFIGEEGGDSSGGAVAGAGDVNGDGYGDILIGAEGSGEGGIDAGQTYLILSNVNPPGPSGLDATIGVDTSYIFLSWRAPSRWAEPLQCYRIYRSLDGMNYEYLGFTKATSRSYTDESVKIGLTYHYLVVADYDQGENYQGWAKVTVTCDLDPDMDGIGNIADIDDDGDGIADHADMFPMNKDEYLDTDLDGVGNFADDDDDNDGLLDSVDLEPLNPMNGLRLDLSSLNGSLVRAQLVISDLFLDLRSDLNGMNTNLSSIIQKMNMELSAQIFYLTHLLGDINASLSYQIGLLSSDIQQFQIDMETDFMRILDALDHDQEELRWVMTDMMNMVQNLSYSIYGANTSILDEIERGIRNISSEIGAGDDGLGHLIDGLLERIDRFQEHTDYRIQNISDLMATMQELESLSRTADRIKTDLDALNGLQTGVNDIQKEQEDAGSDIALNTVLLIAAIFLQVLLLIVGAVILFRRRDGTYGFQEE